MIPRYEQKEISLLWEDLSKFTYFLEVELALIEALEGTTVPKGTAAHIRSKAKVRPERIKEIEAITRHDVIAFCTSITEQVDEEYQRFFHYGVTSSDIIDTAMNLQIKASMDAIIKQSELLLTALKTKAQETKELITLGRSHGMYAEPMSFSAKFLTAYAEFKRRHEDYLDFYNKELTGQLSGAVGNYAVTTPAVEKVAIESLGLKVEPISTQVIPRDRIAKLMNIHALYGSAIERFCTEIRLLHHSDINELHEGFAKGQKGSSTMPHKKNPIATENLTGIARLLRSHALVALENTNLWHERDISHSSAERFILPDSFGCLHYGLKRLTNTINNLALHNEIIEGKVQNNFTYLSSYVLHELIAQCNTTRENLYAIVQKASFEASDELDFFSKIKEFCKNESLGDITLPNIKENGVRTIYLKHFDTIYNRTLNS
ncbi:MAG: adenylosuccinate lyase [Thermoproteota archaeon]|jgi:adenylosuccinate lyase